MAEHLTFRGRRSTDSMDALPVSSNVHTIPTARIVEDDEYSDENIERWLERDKLDPELAEWVRATLGE